MHSERQFTLNQSSKAVPRLAGVGLAAGSIALLAIVIVGETFGLPGSARYRTYESLNRAMGFLLAFEALSLVASYSWRPAGSRGAMKAVWIITLAAWLGLAIGTAAEFWLYSDLPYGESNMRSVAFSVFSISDLVVGLGLLTLGIMILRQKNQSQLLALPLIVYLPLSILTFVVGGSIFLAPTLVSMVLAVLVLSLTLRRGSSE